MIYRNIPLSILSYVANAFRPPPILAYALQRTQCFYADPDRKASPAYVLIFSTTRTRLKYVSESSWFDAELIGIRTITPYRSIPITIKNYE